MAMSNLDTTTPHARWALLGRLSVYRARAFSPSRSRSMIWPSSRSITGFIDGHCEGLTAEAFADRRRWSDKAAREDDPEWEP